MVLLAFNLRVASCAMFSDNVEPGHARHRNFFSPFTHWMHFVEYLSNKINASSNNDQILWQSIVPISLSVIANDDFTVTKYLDIHNGKNPARFRWISSASKLAHFGFVAVFLFFPFSPTTLHFLLKCGWLVFGFFPFASSGLAIQNSSCPFFSKKLADRFADILFLTWSVRRFPPHQSVSQSVRRRREIPSGKTKKKRRSERKKTFSDWVPFHTSPLLFHLLTICELVKCISTLPLLISVCLYSRTYYLVACCCLARRPLVVNSFITLIISSFWFSARVSTTNCMNKILTPYIYFAFTTLDLTQ